MFGCIIYSYIPDSKQTKLDKKAEKLRFVGHSIQSKGYRLIDENTSRVFIRRDVTFNEADFGLKEAEVEQQSSVEVDIDPESELRQENGEQEREEERHYPERRKRVPVRYGIDEYASLGVEGSQINKPSSIEEALASDHAKEWKESARGRISVID